MLIRRTAWFGLGLLLFATAGRAADPELKVGLITESRAYERETASVVIGGMRTPAAKEWVNRVTVALDGERITGEWVAKSRVSATVQDFPRGRDVRAAVRRGQLLLQHPDGSTVTAKIVRRVKREERSDQRD
jgi:hypothetical protein